MTSIEELERLRAAVEDLKCTLLFTSTACEPEFAQRFGFRTVLGVIQEEAEKSLNRVCKNEIGNDNE